MKIEIRPIANGWLVKAAAEPGPNDPLAQRHPLPETFAESPTQLCGLISAVVMDLKHPKDEGKMS